MKIVVYYNKNLKMSEGKLAAQVGHVCKELGREYTPSKFTDTSAKTDIIVVLGLRQNKFRQELTAARQLKEYYHVQKDLGLTEVEEGTITAFGFIE